MIAAEHEKAQRQTIRAWHQGPPNRPLLSAADPPRGPGRYHRRGGRQTWYGSSSEASAWAELARHTLDPIDADHVRRRIGWADFDVVALDLTSSAIQRGLGIRPADLTSDDLVICQTLADVAAEAGFEAVQGPSAAIAAEFTLAVFDKSIAGARRVVDLGVRTGVHRNLNAG